MNMLTKTTLAAVMLAAMAVSAQAQQQGKTRQIQVLAAPGAQVAAAPAADQGPVDVKPEVAQINPAPAPAPAPEGIAPKVELAPAPAPEPKVLIQKVEPKFVAPIFEKPARKAYGYSGYGYKASNCH